MKGIREIFVESPKQIATQVIITAFFTVGAVVWAWVLDNRRYGPYLLLLGLAVASLVLFLINQFNIAFARRRSHISDPELRNRLVLWANTKHDFTIRPSTVADGFSFEFIAEDIEGRKILVRRPSDRNELILAVLVKISGADTLAPPDQKKLKHDLMLEFARFGAFFKNVGAPFDKIEIWTTLLADDCYDEAAFIRGLFYMRRSVALALEVGEVATENAQPATLATVPDPPQGEHH